MVQEKEIAERNAYQELLEEYSQKVIYPQYGEWCVSLILEKLKETDIKDSIDYLNSVFDPKDEYYSEYFEYEPENILGRINEDGYYKNSSLYWVLENAFNEKYFDMYYSLNVKLVKKEPDVVTDLSSNGDTTMHELFNTTLEEIGIEALRKVIFDKISQ